MKTSCGRFFRFQGEDWTRLPEKTLLDGTQTPETTPGEFRLAMGNLRHYLADLPGKDRADKATARETPDAKELARWLPSLAWLAVA